MCQALSQELGTHYPFGAHGLTHRTTLLSLLWSKQTSFTFLCPGPQHVTWKPEKVTLLSFATSPNTSKIVITSDIDLCYTYHRKMHHGLACVSSDEGPDHSKG